METGVSYEGDNARSLLSDVKDTDEAAVDHLGTDAVRVNAATPFRLTDDSVIYIDQDPEKEPLKICGPLQVAALPVMQRAMVGVDY